MKYAIGVDFGTLSARALLVSTETGAQIAEAEYVYPHGVMTDADFTGVRLQKTDAFQHPQDYLDALEYVVNKVLEGIDPGAVAGIGIDFTACTAQESGLGSSKNTAGFRDTAAGPPTGKDR